MYIKYPILFHSYFILKIKIIFIYLLSFLEFKYCNLIKNLFCISDKQLLIYSWNVEWDGRPVARLHLSHNYARMRWGKIGLFPERNRIEEGIIIFVRLTQQTCPCGSSETIPKCLRSLSQQSGYSVHNNIDPLELKAFLLLIKTCSDKLHDNNGLPRLLYGLITINISFFNFEIWKNH